MVAEKPPVVDSANRPEWHLAGLRANARADLSTPGAPAHANRARALSPKRPGPVE